MVRNFLDNFTLFDLCDIYATIGDLVGLNVLGNKILVLNSQKAINDLLDKRGSVYSDRPVFVAVGELMGLDRVRHTA